MNTCFKLIATLLVYLSFSTHASLVITGTRAIYPSDQKNISVKVTNKGNVPVLAQSWLDDGDSNASPESIKVPFILTPPINRIDAGKSQILRIAYIGNTLPQDKESLFWLNVLEVPPKPKDAKGKNVMHLSFRTRIKLLYRPVSLTMSLEDALENLVWKKNNTGFSVYNPSPYYINFTGAQLMVGEKALSDIDTQMVPPKSTLDFKAEKKSDLSQAQAVKFYYLNDYGAEHEVIVSL